MDRFSMPGPPRHLHNGVCVVVYALALYGGADIARQVWAQSTPPVHAYLPSVVRLAPVTATEQQDMEQRLSALEQLLAPLSKNGDELYLTGVNLHVVNGTGRTDAPPNGKGNIIIGYNELRGGTDLEGKPADQRGGSHYLVVGRSNNYGGFGGAVIGSSNESAGEYAVSIGGIGNAADGDFSLTLAGSKNRADGPSAAAIGGTGNLASGFLCLAIGGEGNRCSGDTSAVLGGAANRTGTDARSGTITGGQRNTLHTESGSISGGVDLELDAAAPGAWAAGNLHWP